MQKNHDNNEKSVNEQVQMIEKMQKNCDGTENFECVEELEKQAKMQDYHNIENTENMEEVEKRAEIQTDCENEKKSESMEEVATKANIQKIHGNDKTNENGEKVEKNVKTQENAKNKEKVKKKEKSRENCDITLENMKKKKRKAKAQEKIENSEAAGSKEKEKKTKMAHKDCGSNKTAERTEKVKKKVKKYNCDETSEIKEKVKKNAKSPKNVDCNEPVEIVEEMKKKEEIQKYVNNENIDNENREEMVNSVVKYSDGETSGSLVDIANQNSSQLYSCHENVHEIQQINEVTPEGSEMDDEEYLAQRIDETLPPMKKRKIKSFPKKIIKPKKLQFQKDALYTVKRAKKKKTHITGQQFQNVGLNREMKLDRKQMFISREISSCGTWVQCCECQKWRLLSEIDDPTEIPDKWLCEMNIDENFNSCEKTEQSYDESDHIFTKYSEGSVVWARIAGYPWWPAMIELDPDTGSFYEVVKSNNQYPTHYHVVFFDEKVTRAWVKFTSVMQFVGKENLDLNLKCGKHASFKKEINAAKENALDAIKLPVTERLRKYSFGVRFKGKWCKSVEENITEEFDHKCKKKQKAGKKRKNLGKQIPTTDKMIDVLDNTTVDEILENPEDVLKGFEEVLDSIDSDEEVIEIAAKKSKMDTVCDMKEEEEKKENSTVKQNIKDKTKNKSKPYPKENGQNLCYQKVKKRKLASHDKKVKQIHADENVIKENYMKSNKISDEGTLIDRSKSKKGTFDENKKEDEFDSEILTMDMDKSFKGNKHLKVSCQRKNKFSVPSKCTDYPKRDELLASNLDKKTLERNVQLKFEENVDKIGIPDEQTVPNIENEATEEVNKYLDNELSIDIPVVGIPKHSADTTEVNTSVAVLVTDYDTEGSDPFDMEE